MKQVHSSHIGNISAARRRAGSNAPSLATLLPLCQMLHMARASSRVRTEPCSVHTGHRSKGLGQRWPRALSLSKAWEHQAPKCVPAPTLTCRQPQCWANLNLRTGSDTCMSHGLDKSRGAFWKYYPCSFGTLACNLPSRVRFINFPLIGRVNANKQTLLILWDCWLPWAFLCLSKSRTIWLQGGDTTPQGEMFAGILNHCQWRREKVLISLVPLQSSGGFFPCKNKCCGYNNKNGLAH